MRSEELEGAFGAVASRKSQVARNAAFGDVIGVLVYWCIGGVLRCLSFDIYRLRLVGSRQSAVGKRVASRQSLVARSVAFGDVIGNWLLVIGSVATQRKPKFSILHSQFSIKKTRFLTPHSSLFTSLIFSKERK